MCDCILLMIVRSWLVPPPMHLTPGMEGNSELRSAGDNHAAGFVIGLFGWKLLSQWAIKHSGFTNDSGQLLGGKHIELTNTWQASTESSHIHYAFPKTKCLDDYSQQHEISTQPFIHEYDPCNNKINKTPKWDTQPLQKKSKLSPIHPPSKVPEKYPLTMWILNQLSSQCIPS